MSKAFLVSKKIKFDLSNVDEFGEPTFLFDRHIPSPLRVQEAFQAVEERLETLGFDNMDDFIVLTGPSILVSLLLTAASSWGDLNVLVYDAPNGRYLSKTLQPDSGNESIQVDQPRQHDHVSRT